MKKWLWVKNRLRDVLGFFVRILGVHLIFIRVISRNKATIVVYHDPKPEVLQKHIRYFARYYNFISLSDLTRAIHSREWFRIPAHALVITFDDGHRGNHALLEILKTHRIRPTIYLCSHIVDTRRHYWWKGGVFNPKSLKKLKSEEFLEVLKHKFDFEPEKEYEHRHALDRAELEDMISTVEFGSHTKFHPILTNCHDEECQSEISESKNHLQSFLGIDIEHFCYPNGAYGKRELDFVKDAGYRSARTLEWGHNDASSDPFRLKVIELLDDASINTLCAQLSGVLALQRRLRAALGGILYP